MEMQCARPKYDTPRESSDFIKSEVKTLPWQVVLAPSRTTLTTASNLSPSRRDTTASTDSFATRLKSFVTNKTLVDQECIGRELVRLPDGKLWDLQGSILEEQRVLQSEIDDCLRHADLPKKVYCNYFLYGKDERNVTPQVFIWAGDKSTRKRARAVLKEQVFFEQKYKSWDIKLSELNPVFPQLKKLMQHGVRFVEHVKGPHKVTNGDASSTLGGAVMINKRPYLVTCQHVFTGQSPFDEVIKKSGVFAFDDESDDEGYVESVVEDDSTPRQAADLSEFRYTLGSSALDYAVIDVPGTRLTDETHQDYASDDAPGAHLIDAKFLDYRWDLQRLPPTFEVKIRVNRSSRGDLGGRFLSTTLGVYWIWVPNEAGVQEGDSGAFAYHGREVCGLVIAGDPTNGIAIVVPAHVFVEDMTKLLGKPKLLTGGQYRSLLPPVSAPLKAATPEREVDVAYLEELIRQIDKEENETRAAEYPDESGHQVVESQKTSNQHEDGNQDPDSQSRNSRQPILSAVVLAALHGHADILETLVKNGATDLDRALCAAIVHGHTGCVELLLGYGAGASAFLHEDELRALQSHQTYAPATSSMSTWSLDRKYLAVLQDGQLQVIALESSSIQFSSSSHVDVLSMHFSPDASLIVLIYKDKIASFSVAVKEQPSSSLLDAEDILPSTATAQSDRDAIDKFLQTGDPKLSLQCLRPTMQLLKDGKTVMSKEIAALAVEVCSQVDHTERLTWQLMLALTYALENSIVTANHLAREFADAWTGWLDMNAVLAPAIWFQILTLASQRNCGYLAQYIQHAMDNAEARVHQSSKAKFQQPNEDESYYSLPPTSVLTEKLSESVPLEPDARTKALLMASEPTTPNECILLAINLLQDEDAVSPRRLCDHALTLLRPEYGEDDVRSLTCMLLIALAYRMENKDAAARQLERDFSRRWSRVIDALQAVAPPLWSQITSMATEEACYDLVSVLEDAVRLSAEKKHAEEDAEKLQMAIFRDGEWHKELQKLRKEEELQQKRLQKDRVDLAFFKKSGLSTPPKAGAVHKSSV